MGGGEGGYDRATKETLYNIDVTEFHFEHIPL